MALRRGWTATMKRDTLLALLLALLALVAGIQAQARAPAPAGLDVAKADSILRELRGNPATSQLGDLLRSSGVDVKQLRNAGDKLRWTIFAPNNTAIARLEKSNHISRPQLEKALKTNAGREFLLTHIYNKTALNSTQLRDGEVLTMSSGVNVTIRKFANNSVELVAPGSRAFVVTPDIKVGHSIVHVIDNALLPVDLAKYKAANEAKAKASAPSSAGG